MTSNPPPLVSPIPGLEVRAVLDQDALLTAGLGRTAAGQRVVLLVSGATARPGEREEFTAWGGALTDISAVARISAIADYGHTPDGHATLERLGFAHLLPTTARSWPARSRSTST